ncbi:hypothetical protein ACFLY0_01775 [Patescibacteria group bacterium]
MFIIVYNATNLPGDEVKLRSILRKEVDRTPIEGAETSLIFFSGECPAEQKNSQLDNRILILIGGMPRCVDDDVVVDLAGSLRSLVDCWIGRVKQRSLSAIQIDVELIQTTSL